MRKKFKQSNDRKSNKVLTNGQMTENQILRFQNLRIFQLFKINRSKLGSALAQIWKKGLQIQKEEKGTTNTKRQKKNQ